MKLKLMLISISLILSACGGGLEEDNSTPREFGKLIFNTIKQNRKDVYLNYIYTKDDIKDFQAQFEGSPEKKKQLEENQNSRYIQFSEMLNNSFERIRSEAEEKGITDWTEFEFQRVTFDKKNKNGINAAENTIIEFKSDDYFGFIRMHTIMETSRGWIIVGVPQLGKISRASL